MRAFAGYTVALWVRKLEKRGGWKLFFGFHVGLQRDPGGCSCGASCLRVLFVCAADVSEHPGKDDFSRQGPVGVDERHPRQLLRHGRAAGKGDKRSTAAWRSFFDTSVLL